MSLKSANGYLDESSWMWNVGNSLIASSSGGLLRLIEC